MVRQQMEHLEAVLHTVPRANLAAQHHLLAEVVHLRPELKPAAPLGPAATHGAEALAILVAAAAGFARGAEALADAAAAAGGVLLPEARLLPTGGVTPENVGDWFKAGAAAVGIGTALVGPGTGRLDARTLHARIEILKQGLAAR